MLVLQAETYPAPHADDGLRLCRGEGRCEPLPTLAQALRRAETLLREGTPRVHLWADEGGRRSHLTFALAADLHLARLSAVGWAESPARAIATAFEGTQHRPPEIGQLFLAATTAPRTIAAAYGGTDRRTALVAAERPVAALVRAVQALRGRRIEAASWSEPVPPPLYLAERPRPWFAPRGRLRLAALHIVEGGHHLHLLLEEAPQPPDRATEAEPAFHVVPLGGADEAELLEALAQMEAALEAGEALSVLAARAQAAHAARRAPFTVALVAGDAAALREEVARARQGVPRAFAEGGSWQTPRGSAFTAAPLGGEPLAFVYPGAFNSYPGMGGDLFLRFPALHDRLSAIVEDVGASLAERLIFPRWGAPPDRDDLASAAERLAADGVALIESGTLFALAQTLLLRERFGLRPQAAMGYSLGEVSMLWANGVWRDGEAASRAWQSSPLFREQLFGPKRVLETLWGRADWATWIVKAPREAVEAALAEEPRLFLTIVNLPDEVVVAGESAACRRLIERLDAHALRVPYDAVIHAPPAERAFADFVALYDHETRPLGEPRFYSAASDGPLVPERRALAETLARMSCRPLDFPALVERLYADGVRLFVEVGAQATCTRWIGRLLRGRPHAVRAMDRPGRHGEQALAAVLAMLLAHGVEVQLAPPSEPQRSRSEGMPAAPPSALAAYAENLSRHSQRLAEAQMAFLETQRAMVRQTAALLEAVAAEMASPTGMPGRASLPGSGSRGRTPLFDEAAIREFARGDPERCFGPAYAIFRGRRIPRLPNGDLLLMQRVVALEGEPGRVAVGARLTSEYDVAPDAWFFRDGSEQVPYAVVMEMALQPCGFLAAYLGSTFPYPEADLYFRNLDGEGLLRRLPDLRGRRVVNEVELLGSTAAGGIIIQRYRFALSCEGAPFYEGESTFGYFTRPALEGQAGLDRRPSWRAAHPRAGWRSYEADAFTLPRGHLRLLDRLHFAAEGGEAGLGCVEAEAAVDPAAWFFEAHFYQDPVMPGSLGVEAMHQAMAAFAQWRGLGRHFVPLAGNRVVWKYRGQITRTVAQMRLEVQITAIEPQPDGSVALRGTGNLWRDDRRIYAVQGIGILVRNDDEGG